MAVEDVADGRDHHRQRPGDEDDSRNHRGGGELTRYDADRDIEQQEQPRRKPPAAEDMLAEKVPPTEMARVAAKNVCRL